MQRFFTQHGHNPKYNMKRLSILIIICFVTFASCKKETIISGNIIGKWKYAQTYYSIGGPLIYVPTDNRNQWILFNANGSFQSKCHSLSRQ